MQFGPYIRQVREALVEDGGPLSLREVAKRAEIAPTYLSKIEREELPPPSEDVILKLAAVLGEDPLVLLALGGKVPKRLQEMICKRLGQYSDLIEKLDPMSDEDFSRATKLVRDGDW